MLGAIAFGLVLYPKLIDDSWISFRVARNLVHGFGPVFNPGQRVEAVSNPLWTVALAGASRLGVSLPGTAWAMGLACLAGSAWITSRLVLRWTSSPVAGLVAGLSMILVPNFFRASLAGLETGLYAALLVAGMSLVTDRRRFAATGLGATGLALMWTRPEGVAAALILTVAFALRRDLTGRRSRFGPLATLGAGVAVTETARRVYYGAWIPNSVAAKNDNNTSLYLSLRHSLRPGLKYVHTSLGAPGLVLLLVGLLVALSVVVRRRRVDGFALHVGAGTILLVLGTTVAVHNKGDWMPWARLLIPYLPVAIAVAAPAIWHAVSGGRKRQLATALATGWCVLFAWVLPGSASVYRYSGRVTAGKQVTVSYRPLSIFGHDVFRRPELELGKDLAAVYKPGDVFEIGTLGAIGYGAGQTPLVDVYGLADRKIAKLRIAASTGGKYDPGYLATLRPVLIEDDSTQSNAAAIARLSGLHFCEINSPALNSLRIFVLLECEAAGRIAPALLRSFGGQVTPLEPVRIDISPPSGSAEAHVTVSGAGFTAGETVIATYKPRGFSTRTVALCSATATPTGTFACSGDIPPNDAAGAQGAHKIIAKGMTSLTKIVTTFTLT